MPRMIGDGKTKFTLCLEKPVNPGAPTATELNAGIDASFKILGSDFAWSAADSTAISETPLGAELETTVPGRSTYTAGLTLWRYFALAGGADATEDEVFEALKEKGTTFWAYARETDKGAEEPWAASDEIYLGGEAVNDLPQRLDGTGFIKRRVPLMVQRGYNNITVAAA
ncbi:hypothetical protein PTW37_06500 [Arthrobacter agilis]|uniref:phage tail tube protein n=1 Tax=Arthrobacter agilis TaxID=37921 RepID=UPI002365E689|nr:hypothetical protein [Arthrobacter agilis]WDF34544.1 hypothetical protein PTW37_06500 [Arthrobacter agilis]